MEQSLSPNLWVSRDIFGEGCHVRRKYRVQTPGALAPAPARTPWQPTLRPVLRGGPASEDCASVSTRGPDSSSPVLKALECTMPPGLGVLGMIGLSCLAGAGIAVAAGVGMTWLQVRGGCT